MNIDKHVSGSQMNHSFILMKCCLTNSNVKGSQMYDKIFNSAVLKCIILTVLNIMNFLCKVMFSCN